MIEMNNVIIRPMKDGEQKEIVRMGRRAFKLIEALFVSKPKLAMVAEGDGKLLGSILYKDISTDKKKIAYIDYAFVDPDYAGMGIGKILYKKTFDELWKQGYDVLTALVKDDNVGSWKLFEENQFKKVSCKKIIKSIGWAGFARNYFLTPFSIAVGLDFYMADISAETEEKKSSISESLSFFLANMLLLLPLWFRIINKSIYEFLLSVIAYLTVLSAFWGSRYLGNFLIGNHKKVKFRLNNGGSFLTFLMSFWGNVFLMNGNWYPVKYENTEEFRKNLAIPELIKWVVFSGLPIMAIQWNGNIYWDAVRQISCIYLIFMSIPVYPFESFGGGRIYHFNKKLWLILCLTTLAELIYLP